MNNHRVVIVAMRAEDFEKLQKAQVLPAKFYTTWADFKGMMSYKNALAVARDWGVQSGVRIARYFGYLKDGEKLPDVAMADFDGIRMDAGTSEV
jgi:hypothetical protein